MGLSILVEGEWRTFTLAEFETAAQLAQLHTTDRELQPEETRQLARIFRRNTGLTADDYQEHISDLARMAHGIKERALRSRTIDEALGVFTKAAHAHEFCGDMFLFASAYHGIDTLPLEQMAIIAYGRAADQFTRAQQLPGLIEEVQARGLDSKHGIDFRREERRLRLLHDNVEYYHTLIGALSTILPQIEQEEYDITIIPSTTPKEETLLEEAETDSVRFLSKMERRILLSRLDFDKLRRRMNANVLGQEEAIDEMLQLLLHYRTGLAEQNGLLNIFAAGPTGVGKNHLVEVLQTQLEELTERHTLLEKVECVNYDRSASLNTLLGSWPGYVNSNLKGKLTTFAEQSAAFPFSFLILDEFEKADKRLELALLPILDKGYTSDNRGRHVDLRGTLLYFTSNLGYENWRGNNALGFRTDEQRDRAHAAAVQSAARQQFNPEFINRLHFVHFNHLTPEMAERIVERELGLVQSRVRDEFSVRLTWTPGVSSYLCEEGYSHEYGARPLRRTINEQVIFPIDLIVHQSGQGLADEGDVQEVLERIDGLRQEEKTLGGREAYELISDIYRRALPRLDVRTIRIETEDSGLVFEVR